MADLVTYATDEVMTMAVTGFAPNGFFAHFFGNPADEATFLDPTGYNDLKIKAVNGAAGGAGTVVTQQLRP